MFPSTTDPGAGPRRGGFTTAVLMWLAAAASFLIWIELYWVRHLPGSFMHVFLVGAIGLVLMNLVAHYWSHE